MLEESGGNQSPVDRKDEYSVILTNETLMHDTGQECGLNNEEEKLFEVKADLTLGCGQLSTSSRRNNKTLMRGSTWVRKKSIESYITFKTNSDHLQDYKDVPQDYIVEIRYPTRTSMDMLKSLERALNKS
jgi:hypothetical protein